MVLMTTECLPLELTQVIFRYFWGLLLVSIVKSIRFHLSKKSALIVTKFKQLGRVSTFHFQASLPRLPLPKLRDTCQQYLTAQEGLLDKEAFATTNKLTQEFASKGSTGWRLHERLVKQDQANRHTNFTAEYLKNKYLKSRSSLIHTNPFGIGKQDTRNPPQNVKVAQFLWTVVQYYIMLRDKVLEPQVFCLNGKKKDRLFNLLRFLPEYISSYGAYMMNIIPLDMSIICNAFCKARLPGHEIDRIIDYKDSSHVVITCNGHFYRVRVIGTDGKSVDLNTIFTAVEHIMSDSITPPSFPVGFITAMERSECAKAREELAAIGDNASLLKTIDSSILVLCIDDKTESELELGKIFLHNNGYNRWFDKTLQLIVTRDCHFGFNFEHSSLTGGSLLPLFDYLYTNCIKAPFPEALEFLDETLQPVKLEFSLSESSKRLIEKGWEDAGQIAAGLFFHSFNHLSLNKRFIKSKKMSSDGLIQLSFQIAYYHEHRKLPSLSEACSTAAFLQGRTETVRPMSVHTLKAAQAMEPGSGVSDDEKISLIRNAVTFNSDLIKKGATGRGFDRHLFALKCLAESEGLSLPFFSDKGYQHFSTVDVATSAYPTTSANFGGFAPFNYNSFGITYFIYEEFIGIYIVSHPTHDGARYIANLQKVMDDLYELLKKDSSSCC